MHIVCMCGSHDLLQAIAVSSYPYLVAIQSTHLSHRGRHAMDRRIKERHAGGD
jgi:hypothetical protein